jgi:hypothetical protein
MGGQSGLPHFAWDGYPAAAVEHAENARIRTRESGPRGRRELWQGECARITMAWVSTDEPKEPLSLWFLVSHVHAASNINEPVRDF